MLYVKINLLINRFVLFSANLCDFCGEIKIKPKALIVIEALPNFS